MKKIQPWLLPGLTLLLVAAAVLLPQRISQLRDQALFAGAHTETLPEDASANAGLPDLPQRIKLLESYSNFPQDFNVTTVTIDGDEPDESLMAEIDSLLSCGAIPRELAPTALTVGWARWIFLRDPGSGASVCYLEACLYGEQGVHGIRQEWDVLLDYESGYILRLYITDSLYFPIEAEASAWEAGCAYLDHLGLPYSGFSGATADSSRSAALSLDDLDNSSVYCVSLGNGYFSIALAQG